VKTRLDNQLVKRGLTSSRSQAENYIKLGRVTVNQQVVTKPGAFVSDADEIELTAQEQYVSRAGLKLASVAKTLQLDFQDKVVLDVGSSTGGFTDYALQHGTRQVVAVDVGTDQLHPTLRDNPCLEVHEKTDIRDFQPTQAIDLVVIDVSFISLRDILLHIADIVTHQTQVVAMVKPQFEAGKNDLKHKGVVKNERMRRDILKAFETWVQTRFVIVDKADSQVSGAKGNRERFYLLRKT
jgi:23S rRNA (cytidine1920-2'-O)/16S rRNA (cytidine1409-2'-O)-methyltransferase